MIDRRHVPPVPLVMGFLIFLGILIALVTASFLRRDVSAFVPDEMRAGAPPATSLTYDTLTVDARDATRWRLLDLARGSVVDASDSLGWDLAVRRFHIIANGEVAVLDTIGFDDLREAPADGYLPTEFSPDTVNPALDRWYRYSLLSHLLHPLERVWVLRTRDGRYAKFTMLSYYCPGLAGGCVTIRYRYQPDGSRVLR